MANQYEADKIIRLLQFCCWREGCEMNHTGLKRLQEIVEEYAEEKNKSPDRNPKKAGHPIPNYQYMVDLLSDAKQAAKTDNLVGRNARYIDLLIEFSGFNNWKHFEDNLYRASEFIDREGQELGAFPSLKIAVAYPKPLEKTMLSDFKFVERTENDRLLVLPSSAEDFQEGFQFVEEKLDEYPFVVWMIPGSWKTELPLSKEWKTLVSSKRILPVWLDPAKPWEIDPLLIPDLLIHQTISGLPGALLGILFIYAAMQKPDNPTTKTQTPVRQIRDNHGTLFLGDIQIRGANISMKDIHQTIYKSKDHD